MKKYKCQRVDSIRLLVLVPHRDSRLPLRAWSASLFAAGLPGAWSFPWVAPLAVLHRPLPSEQLTSLAHAMRQHVNQSGGKIIAGAPSCFAQVPAAIPANEQNESLSVFGPELNLALPDSFFSPAADALNCSLSPLVLGSALHSPLSPVAHPPPTVFFRAAALANMSLRPLHADEEQQNGFSFEWEIGKLHWLPKAVTCSP